MMTDTTESPTPQFSPGILNEVAVALQDGATSLLSTRDASLNAAGHRAGAEARALRLRPEEMVISLRRACEEFPRSGIIDELRWRHSVDYLISVTIDAYFDAAARSNR